MKLYKGRPEDESGRLEKEIAVYDLLDQLQIPFERIDHEVVPTIEACQEIDRLLNAKICKNLFLCNAQKTKFYLLMISGEKKFKTKDLSHQIGSARLSFADAEHMEQYLGVTPGSVTVMGLMNDKENHVRLLIEREVLEAEMFGCHPCINTTSLRMKMSDLLEKFLPYTGHEYTVVEL
ncbi:MAG: prolyl-tRNA synthetase associated domain-containing protein [Lachnospiraceae bacterium]|nr:prolyl-tRNA synthetase associated domain-containing protein [Robinsoniella sp.]MDY3765614.1 prolyl-tRNA synthetase associated domain-containing protein [Lachnospiraceae bacterium]